METRLTMTVLSMLAMFVVVVLALVNDVLLPSQQPVNKVWLPVIANGSIAGNFILLSIALYLIGAYSHQWSTTEIVVALVLGMLISYLLWNFVYQNGKYEDGLAKPFSLAGKILMVYGGALYAATILFYFFSSPSFEDVVLVGALFALYVAVANHVVLDLFNKNHSWPWCPDIFTEESSPRRFIIGGEIAVVLATLIKLW